MRRETFVCSGCGGPQNRIGQRFCKACHAKYMRGWRKTHRLTEPQRVKDNCRSYAGVYKRRGKIQPQPCEKCASDKVEMHHEDYSKPLQVKWLCRPCHLALHNGKFDVGH